MLFDDWPKQHFLNSTLGWVHLAWGIFGLVSIFVSCLFDVSTLSNQRRYFIFSRPIKLQKGQNYQNFKISKFYKILNFFKYFIEIYHACKWYLPKNTGWETGQISRAEHNTKPNIENVVIKAYFKSKSNIYNMSYNKTINDFQFDGYQDLTQE